MTGRGQREGVAAEFLRDVLAGGPLGVPKLEAMARTAGLLGEGQRITHVKVFKKAKKSLGIRSVRNGFGDAGEWLWRLERQPASPVSKPLAQPPPSIEDTYAEALEEVPPDVRARRIPSSWVDGVARLARSTDRRGKRVMTGRLTLTARRRVRSLNLRRGPG